MIVFAVVKKSSVMLDIRTVRTCSLEKMAMFRTMRQGPKSGCVAGTRSV